MLGDRGIGELALGEMLDQTPPTAIESVAVFYVVQSAVAVFQLLPVAIVEVEILQ
jgi:hypothetical protein